MEIFQIERNPLQKLTDHAPYVKRQVKGDILEILSFQT